MTAATYYDESARKTIAAFIELKARKGWGLRAVGRVLGVSRGLASPLLRCTYQSSSVPELIEKMRSVLERDALRARQPKAPAFVETTVADRVGQVLNLALTERRMVLILGPSGIGKTHTVRWWVDWHPEAILLEGGPGSEVSPVLRTLGGMVEVSTGSTVYELRLALIHKLRGSERIIILDDVDATPESTLQALRMIADDAHIGLALVGTHGYLVRMRRKRSATFSQILRRIAYAEHLQTLSDHDIRLLLESYDLDAEARKIAVEQSYGLARRALQAVIAAPKYNGQAGTICADSLRAAFAQLMPPDFE